MECGKRAVIEPILSKLANKEGLSPAEIAESIDAITRGDVPAHQISLFLTALTTKGETEDEITAAATVLRQKAIQVPNRASRAGILVDTCGTGCDGSGAFNVSTTTAFVVAGAGLKVAKHGNHGTSSRSGSSDVLLELGINLSVPAEHVGRCIDEVGIGFLYARALHPAWAHVAAVRKQLRFPTIFNLLGPLSNPAGATVQLIGVYTPSLADKLSRVLGRLGLRGGCVVCCQAADGTIYDELTVAGRNTVCQFIGGEYTSFCFEARDVGLASASPDALRGGDAAVNANICRSILAGEPGPRRDTVLLNAAACLVVAGKARSVTDGIELAATSIDSGAALAKLEAVRQFTIAS
jgi:anthranilate phosphoribosyltransferase